jgi:LEA14-like dessication related protein
MNFKKYIAILSIVFLAFACKRPQSFDYRDTKNLKISKFGFDKTSLSMDLVYFNPNSFGVTLKKVDCDIFIDKNFLGHFTLDTTISIEKRSEFVLPAKMLIDMKNIYKNALNLLFSKEIVLNVKGTTRLKKVGINFTVPVNYEGKHKLNL